MPTLPTLHTRHAFAAALAACALAGSACADAVDSAVGTIDDARQAVSDGAGLVQFCTAAVQVAQAVQDEDVDRAVEAGGSMVEHAPDEIAPEAETVLSGAKQAQAGNPAAVRTEEFQAAAQAVADFAQDRCDPR